MRPVVLVLILLALARPALSQQSFTVGPVTAPPGAAAAGTLEVPARAGDTGTSIPIR